MSAGASGARGGASNRRFVLVAAAISAMGGLLFGYDTGITSGATGTFWLYAAFGIIGLLFFFRIVPETKGRSLEDIEAELAERASIGSGSAQKTTT